MFVTPAYAQAAGGAGGAGAIAQFVPLILIFALGSKYFIKGLMAGAMKG